MTPRNAFTPRGLDQELSINMSNSRSPSSNILEFLRTRELNVVDAIKKVLTAQIAVKRLPSANLIFRLYELLKNDSRFFRIADASCLWQLASTINVV